MEGGLNISKIAKAAHVEGGGAGKDTAAYDRFTFSPCVLCIGPTAALDLVGGDSTTGLAASTDNECGVDGNHADERGEGDSSDSSLAALERKLAALEQESRDLASQMGSLRAEIRGRKESGPGR